jgi:hypothetical protein
VRVVGEALATVINEGVGNGLLRGSPSWCPPSADVAGDGVLGAAETLVVISWGSGSPGVAYPFWILCSA